MVPMPKIACVGGGELLQDGEHQFLAAHLRGAFDALLLGEREQLGRFLLLEFLEIHVSFQSGWEMTHAPRPTGRPIMENGCCVVR